MPLGLDKQPICLYEIPDCVTTILHASYREMFHSQRTKDAEGRLLRDIALIQERWMRCFHKLL